MNQGSWLHGREPFLLIWRDALLYERQPGETMEAWRVRLMLMKVNKETDLDWIEIRDLCEMECSVDQLRKMA